MALSSLLFGLCHNSDVGIANAILRAMGWKMEAGVQLHYKWSPNEMHTAVERFAVGS